MQNGYPPTPYQTPPQSASQQAPVASVPVSYTHLTLPTKLEV